MMPLESVQVSLVQSESFREVLSENPEAPVLVETIAPQPSSGSDSGPLPALLLPPPAQVQFRLGSLGNGYQLRFAIGYDQAAFSGEDSGQVRFRFSTKDKVLFDETLAFGPDVPREQQVWLRKTLDMSELDGFLLETELVAGKGVPPAAFASLEIVEHSERPRTRATVDSPNVVLIVVDTLRFDRLGCYGNQRGLTPNIDALAARGTLFESAYSAAPWTWPSTASILTGLTPAEHGVTSHQACFLADELPTLAEALQRAGWTTGGFSCNPLISSSKAFDQGFEAFQSYEWEHGDVLIDNALAWMKEMAEWRFLLYLQFIDPHDYRPTAQAEEQFVGPQPEGFSRAGLRSLLAKKVYGQEFNAEQLADQNRYLAELYDASVWDVDREIGRLIADIEARGQLDKTIFIVTADHGEEFLEHGLLYHGSQLYRELVGIPLVMAGPLVPTGRRVEDRVENRFLAPTVLQLLDVEGVGGLQGLNLLDSDATAEAAGEAAFVSTTQGIWPRANGPHWRNLTMYGVRLKHEFFLWVPEGPDGNQAIALFDLAQDPGATQDVALVSPDRCIALQKLIERWLARGEAVRPNVMSGGDAAMEMLLKLGYVDKDH
ncbi:MAG: arylsulfatase A-like enzyme [Candidatus Paceibacteria bacterium]|jgi:arylsulfatase A-like enzyme